MNKKCLKCDCLLTAESSYKKQNKVCDICKKCKLFEINTEIKNMLSQGVFPHKACRTCKVVKNYTCFYSNIREEFGQQLICIDCDRIKRKSNKEKQKERNKTIKLKEKQCLSCLEFKSVDYFRRDCCAADGFVNYCKTCKRNEFKIVPEFKECAACSQIKAINKFNKNYHTGDGFSSRCKKCNSAINKINRPRSNKRETERRKIDNNFRIKKALRTRVWHAITKKGIKKSKKTEELLGTSYELFLLHLENQFLPYMSWKNYGSEWHIDHIIPCSAFDLTQESEQNKCFHYTNQMPRWATTEIALKYGSNQIGNLEKQNKLINSAGGLAEFLF